MFDTGVGVTLEFTLDAIPLGLPLGPAIGLATGRVTY